MINYSTQFDNNEDLIWFLEHERRSSVLSDLDDHLRDIVKYNDKRSEEQINAFIEVRELIHSFCIEYGVKLNKY